MRRVFLTLVFAGATCVHARDFLDTFNGKGWSPDSHWLAFNPVGQEALFFIAPNGNKTLLLKPVGDAFVDTRNIFSAEAPPGCTKAEAMTITVPSPGRSKFEMVEWSPNSTLVAYNIDRKTRGIFSIVEQAVTNRLNAGELLPWQSEHDVRVSFEMTAATKDRAAKYSLRVVQPGGKVVKEIAFENPKEIRQMSLLRFTEASFVSPNKEFLLYPRLGEKGWRLFLEPIDGSKAARPLTEPTVEAPLEWKLSADSQYLAIAQSTSAIQIGAIDDWEHAETVPLSSSSITLAWCPDNRYLACVAKEQLYLLVRGNEEGHLVSDFVLLSDFCSPIFWGWRGTKLFFNNVRAHSTSLYGLDVERSRRPEQLVKPRNWQSAPRDRTVSPDGSMFVCLMMEQDPEGRLSPQVWKIDLKPDAEWQRLYTFKPTQ